MSKKSSAGFTKSAQSERFQRNRDIKLTSNEQKYEDKIAKTMNEGICQKCRDIVTWKFNYDKYKPLKKIGTCHGCKQKAITKAYRTLCDACGHSKNACPGCAKVWAPAVVEEDAADADPSPQSAAAAPTAAAANAGTELVAADGEINTDTAELKDDEDKEGEEGEDIDDNASEQTASAASGGFVMDTIWDEKKYKNMAANKYSKSRVVGTEEDAEA